MIVDIRCLEHPTYDGQSPSKIMGCDGCVWVWNIYHKLAGDGHCKGDGTSILKGCILTFAPHIE